MDKYDDGTFRVDMESSTSGKLVLYNFPPHIPSFEAEPFLEFELSGSRYKAVDGIVMDMQHVFVSEDKRGLGLASKICDKAFELAEFYKHPVKPSCTYVANTYLPRRRLPPQVVLLTDNA